MSPVLNVISIAIVRKVILGIVVVSKIRKLRPQKVLLRRRLLILLKDFLSVFSRKRRWCTILKFNDEG
jgi:hypothetical protein